MLLGNAAQCNRQLARLIAYGSSVQIILCECVQSASFKTCQLIILLHRSCLGEDRWLCTLLLQQGWRVEYNAASDAYTNSPQEFKEFYNQRRRWGPSTLANTLDLLHSGRETVKRNTSISMLYIFYQIFTVASSILGPASVTLMIAGTFSKTW